ncbi:hypothetical protein M153_7460002754 [Pseudoloma neurophilia]|uniref:Uncharacterized protein n=1 Tax=Pseudoloma neurophilia TaxID=146866 RepID=A0A0R0M1T7_9MICR|nr:hypothetical protein M153_7460002754 [Pseudoloma neurophilia]
MKAQADRVFFMIIFILLTTYACLLFYCVVHLVTESAEYWEHIEKTRPFF